MPHVVLSTQQGQRDRTRLSKEVTSAQGTLARCSAASHSRTPGRGSLSVWNSSEYTAATRQARRCATPHSRVHCSTCRGRTPPLSGAGPVR